MSYNELNEYYRKKLFTDIDFYEFEERAAIMEFDGNLEPAEAAKQAFLEIQKNYSLQRKVKSCNVERSEI